MTNPSIQRAIGSQLAAIAALDEKKAKLVKRYDAATTALVNQHRDLFEYQDADVTTVDVLENRANREALRRIVNAGKEPVTISDGIEDINDQIAVVVAEIGSIVYETVTNPTAATRESQARDD